MLPHVAEIIFWLAARSSPPEGLPWVPPMPILFAIFGFSWRFHGALLPPSVGPGVGERYRSPSESVESGHAADIQPVACREVTGLFYLPKLLLPSSCPAHYLLPEQRLPLSNTAFSREQVVEGERYACGISMAMNVCMSVCLCLLFGF